MEKECIIMTNHSIYKGEFIYKMKKKLKSFIKLLNSKLKNILENNPLLSAIFIPIFTSIAATFIVYVASGLWHVLGDINDINEDVTDINKEIATINKNYTDLEVRMTSIEDISNSGNDNTIIDGNDNTAIDGDNNFSISGGSVYISVQFNQGAMSDYYKQNDEDDSYIPTQVNAVKGEVQREAFYFPKLNIQEKENMGVNLSTNKSVTLEDLSGEKVFSTYQIDDQEILFYGQFTEEGLWDGDCLVNIYENGKLVNITEAKYNKGILQEYQQVISYTNSRGNSVWSISNREMETDKISSGESYTYYKIEECNKKFHTADVDDLFYVKDFEKEYCSVMEGYYYGQTSDGFYNDSTGKSYNIKYFENGKIRTLYVGNFVNGKYKDNSGNAWYITKEENTEYMYFIGEFDNNTPAEKANKDNFKNNLTLDNINEILVKSGKIFKNLDWQSNE